MSRKRPEAMAVWSAIVHQRCGQRCVLCGSKKRLSAHHWAGSWKWHPETRYTVANGLCVCWHCHKYRCHDCADWAIMQRLRNAAVAVYGREDVAELFGVLSQR